MDLLTAFTRVAILLKRILLKSEYSMLNTSMKLEGEPSFVSIRIRR